MGQTTDGDTDLFREAMDHIKACAFWMELTEAQQDALVVEYIRKRRAQRCREACREAAGSEE